MHKILFYKNHIRITIFGFEFSMVVSIVYNKICQSFELIATNIDNLFLFRIHSFDFDVGNKGRSYE